MGKRSRNEGSIFWEKKRKRWCAIVPAAYSPDGKRKAIRDKTREAVATRLAQAMSGRRHHSPAANGTLGGYLKDWLATNKDGWKPRTHQSYTDVCTRHIIPSIGSVPMWKLGPRDVIRCIEAVRIKGLTRTVEYVRDILKSALSDAVEQAIIPLNVAKMTPAPRVPVHKADPFTPDELRVFLNTARKYEGGKYEALILLAVLVGLREGEVAGLSWADVDMDAGYINVRHTLGRNGELGTPKTDDSVRTLKLPDVVVAALERHRKRVAGVRMATRSSEDFIFITSTGKPYSQRNLLRLVHRLCALAKIGRRRFHDLRHSAAIALLGHGVTIETVSDVLGHSSIVVTKDVYGAFVPQSVAKAADAMDEIAGKTK